MMILFGIPGGIEISEWADHGPITKCEIIAIVLGRAANVNIRTTNHRFESIV
jgi:hypothetical protein